ncbi:hypothetical protein [uncultured Hyphomonas sp.]|uniref:hypothetical protein n=1 Tax=uncultured Hyphomonas sp. TaxID=225298 RepID=UPI002AAAA114|nr:hypothetical protein [uncultured Hyphomonas sp.]
MKHLLAAFLLLAFAPVALATPPGWSCNSAWEHIPELDPDPEYQSQNDPDLVYRERVVRYHHPYSIWASEVSNAATSFIQIRAVIAGWSNTLEAAEIQFWQDYDADGEVSQVSVNELAYWLHKREVWTNYRSNAAATMNQTVGGGSGDVTKFILGGNGQHSFLSPGIVPPGAAPSPAGTIADSYADSEFQSYVRKLVRHSFLTHSACRPERQNTPSGRVLQDILFPHYAETTAEAQWNEVQAWAAASPGRMQQLDTILSELTLSQKLDSGSWEIIRSVMSGEVTSASDVGFKRFKQFTERFSTLRYIYIEKAQQSANGFSLSYTDEKSFPRGTISIRGATLDQVQPCVADNWDTIRKYYYDKTARKGMAILLEHSMTGIQYRKHLAYISLIACGSADGLDDPRVEELISTFAD